ncbi:hypothetical protein ACFUIW_07995 [Streptomyces sp. NPDC057245]|uniref:hypothetical protein n=1 Tax=Streptomyces sp. NPDC057245 TaxID=3346065 RepID=UPI00363F90FE
MTGTDAGGPADRAGAEAHMRARHGQGDVSGTEALLAAALRADPVDAEGRRRAVAAYRAARDTEPRRAARTRRRDDWRPRGTRRTGRSPRTALSVLLASATLGGVAYAAIAEGGSAPAPGPDRTRSSAPGKEAQEDTGTDAPTRPVTSPAPSVTPSGPGASAPPGRPDPARDTEAHCRAYERLEGRGKAREAPAWQRLVEAAGGEEHVAAYCARQRTAGPAPGRSNGNGQGNGPGTDNGTENGAATGNGNGSGSGNSTGNGNATGNATTGNATTGNGSDGQGNGTSGTAADQPPGGTP